MFNRMSNFSPTQKKGRAGQEVNHGVSVEPPAEINELEYLEHELLVIQDRIKELKDGH